jgi:membrane protein required for colicin V production
VNWLDLLIVAGLAWFTWSAYRSGLVSECITLASIILALPIAGIFYEDLAVKLEDIFGGNTADRVAAFLMVFLAVVLAGQLAAIAARQVMQVLHVGWADRSAGALFGFMKGLLIAEALLILFVTYPEPDIRREVRESPVASFLVEDVPLAKMLLPSEFEASLDSAEGAPEAAAAHR